MISKTALDSNDCKDNVYCIYHVIRYINHKIFCMDMNKDFMN